MQLGALKWDMMRLVGVVSNSHNLTVCSSTWANGTQSVACQLTVLALLGPTKFSAKIGQKSRSSRNQERLKTGRGIAGSCSKRF